MWIRRSRWERGRGVIEEKKMTTEEITKAIEEAGPEPAGLADLTKEFHCISCGGVTPWIDGYQVVDYPPGPGSSRTMKPLCRRCFILLLKRKVKLEQRAGLSRLKPIR
jgi:hypothetical protein